MRDYVWRYAADVGDWTSLQVGDLLGYVELVVFDSDYDPTWYKSATVF